MLKTLITFFGLTTLISCFAQTPTFPALAAILDSLKAAFLTAWNNKDSAAISRAIADNAILMTNSRIYKGLSEISDNWKSGGVKVGSNLTTSSVVDDSDSKIGYSAGTYTHDLTPPGGQVFKINGNYNFAWTKQTNGEWKLTFIHIEDLTRRR